MSAPRYLDPASSVLAYFGAELRRLRAAAGISQEDLAQRISYSASLVGMIETARRAPARDFALRCDGVLDTGLVHGGRRLGWADGMGFSEWNAARRRDRGADRCRGGKRRQCLAQRRRRNRRQQQWGSEFERW